MNLIDRYETRAARAYDRAVRNFDSHRARRRRASEFAERTQETERGRMPIDIGLAVE